jgi:hypothetical protein
MFSPCQAELCHAVPSCTTCCWAIAVNTRKGHKHNIRSIVGFHVFDGGFIGEITFSLSEFSVGDSCRRFTVEEDLNM